MLLVANRKCGLSASAGDVATPAVTTRAAMSEAIRVMSFLRMIVFLSFDSPERTRSTVSR
jgi:hypothetical protein